MVPALPLLVLGLATAAYSVKKHRDAFEDEQNRKIVTPERQMVFDTAMNQVADPDKLIQLANVFAGEGLTQHAELLRKRAELRAMPKEIRDKRREAFRKAMRCQSKRLVMNMVGAFESEGCMGASAALRNYARGLPEGS